jgi:hypothetical protein
VRIQQHESNVIISDSHNRFSFRKRKAQALPTRSVCLSKKASPTNIIIYSQSNYSRYLLVGLGGFVRYFWNLVMISSINPPLQIQQLIVGVASPKRYNLEYSQFFKAKKMLNEATIERRLINLEQTAG